MFWGDAVRRDPKQHVANMRVLAEWFAAGKIRPAITERVSLADAADAIARMANRQVKGKVVILPASFWGLLRDLRARGVGRDEGLPALRAAVERDFGL